MDKILSIIIPVYNVEKYLNDCIDSIIEQVNEKCEIILIDDGSTDNSGHLCDLFSSNNSLVKVFHKENGGLGSARNAGLDVATGKYVAFLDSDDMLSPKCISVILNRINHNEFDMCFMQAEKLYSDGTRESLGDDIHSKNICNKSKKSILNYLSRRKKFPGSSCTKIYRKEFLDSNSIRFPEKRLLSEDLSFVMKCIYSCDVFDCLDCDYYIYRQNREGSITNAISNRTLDGLIYFIDTSIDTMTVKSHPKNCYAKFCLSFVTYEYVVYLYNYAQSVFPYQYWEYALKNKWVLKYGRNYILKLIKIVSYLGLKTTVKIVKRIKG